MSDNKYKIELSHGDASYLAHILIIAQLLDDAEESFPGDEQIVHATELYLDSLPPFVIGMNEQHALRVLNRLRDMADHIESARRELMAEIETIY